MTISKALDLVLLDYKVKRKRSADDATTRIRHLRRLLPAGEMRDLTTAALLEYASARGAEGVQGATINREIAILRRSCTLSNEPWPVAGWEKLPESEPRQGRIDGDVFTAILQRLLPKYQAVARFLYYTGWRVNEGLGLQWSDVGLAANELRLPARLSKNKRSRVIPMIPQLRALLEAQAGPHEGIVFRQEDGRPIPYFTFYHAWCKAREKAGAPKAIPHDFRRTAATKLVKEAKVDRRTAMRMTGHLTESAFIRYDITDDEALRDAAEKFGKLLH